ncbi:MAG: hypothetical protein V4697_01330 [Patescibacteria group bacterium]
MKKLITLTTILILVLGGYAFYNYQKKAHTDDGPTPEALSEISKYKYTETYVDPSFGFSFNYPEGFSVLQVPDEDGGAILIIQNSQKEIGLQIAITPFGEGYIQVTPEIIKGEMIDMTIENSREVSVGTLGKGLAFESDNENFGGASSEIWFIVRSHLYQMTTYAREKAFLQGLFATWKFN